MLNLVIFGPPGSGKGTQSARIAEKYGLVHISTGEIFRAEIREKTELGLKVKSIIESGELVPDDLLADIMRSAIHKHRDPEGFIFDGYPRTIPQARDLDVIMKEKGTEVTRVLALEVDEKELISRLLNRARLEGRADDTMEAIQNRLDVYNEQTKPLLDYYREKGKLTLVEGVGSIDEIFGNICKEIDKIK